MTNEAATTQSRAPRFSNADAADLRWFFSVGQSAFEYSTMGHTLERADQFGHHSDGSRIPSRRDVDARVWRLREIQCNGVPHRLPEQQRQEMRILLQSTGADMDPEVTAQPTRQQENPEPSYEPDDAAITRYASVSRVLCRMPPSHRRALALYYGLRGHRWASHHLGRLLMLYPETRAGQELLSLHRERAGRPDDRIAQEWLDERANAKHPRGRLLRRARSQALQLLTRAKTAYAEVRS